VSPPVSQLTSRDASLIFPCCFSPRVPDQTPVDPTSVPTPPSTSSQLRLPVPFKHERPFQNGARGATVWYATELPHEIVSPPCGLQVVAGTLYVHLDTSKKVRTIWLFEADAGWKIVDGATQTPHPTCRDRVLNVRFDGTPSWVVAAPTTNGNSRRFKK
jgi:hypothetical protein